MTTGTRSVRTCTNHGGGRNLGFRAGSRWQSANGGRREWRPQEARPSAAVDGRGRRRRRRRRKWAASVGEKGEGKGFFKGFYFLPLDSPIWRSRTNNFIKYHIYFSICFVKTVAAYLLLTKKNVYMFLLLKKTYIFFLLDQAVKYAVFLLLFCLYLA